MAIQMLLKIKKSLILLKLEYNSKSKFVISQMNDLHEHQPN